MRIMTLGLGLLLLGFLLVYLMVLRLLDPGFMLSFLAYAASLIGLVFGLIGAINHGRP